MSPTPFKAAWWLLNPHLQTIWPTFCRKPIKTTAIEHERFELPDGDFLDLSWVRKNERGPLVLLLHGLEGSVKSPYAQGMLQAINKRQWRGVFMHFRGCGGEHNRLPRSYHSGETSDVDVLVKALRKREPETVMAAVGYSLGGNVLLKWLGETGAENPLCAAAAISVPLELHNSANRMRRGLSRFYQKHFLKCLAKRLSGKFQQYPVQMKLPEFSELKSMWEFDDKVTAPLHGFAGAIDYYMQSSSRQFLDKIKIPTLLIQAKDDPFMTPDIIPKAYELSKDVTLEVTQRGGHVGFIMGTVPWRPRYWLEERVPEFLNNHFQV